MLVDGYVFAVAYLVKLYRVGVLWFVMYLVEKAYLSTYLTDVYVQRKKPVSLVSYVAVCLAVEAVLFFAAMLILYLMMSKFKGPTNSFAIDAPLLRALLVDYAATTALILALGAAVSSVVQDCQLFRYSDDGLRGIRAAADILLQISLLVLAVPFFLFVAA